MGYKDNIRQGSFRGVPFLYDDHGMSGGRRGPDHQFPGRDTPYAEDLGRKQRSHKLRFFVLGDDYMTARDNLVDALEKSGPGVLVHPWLGTLTVQVREFEQGESRSEGRMARFSATFVEAGENQYPDEDDAETEGAAAETAASGLESAAASAYASVVG